MVRFVIIGKKKDGTTRILGNCASKAEARELFKHPPKSYAPFKKVDVYKVGGK